MSADTVDLHAWCARCATFGCSPGCPDGDPITVPAALLAAVLTTNPDPAARNELTEMLRAHYIGDEDYRWRVFDPEAALGTDEGPR